MKISRQECWGGLPFPSPGDLPDPDMEPGSPRLPSQAGSCPFEPPGEPLTHSNRSVKHELTKEGIQQAKCGHIGKIQGIPTKNERFSWVNSWTELGEISRMIWLIILLESPMVREDWQAAVHGVTRDRPDLATTPPLPPTIQRKCAAFMCDCMGGKNNPARVLAGRQVLICVEKSVPYLITWRVLKGV